jgi:hypothetical protein
VVSEVPAGAQFIINHHWINTGDEPIEAQAEMITVPPDSEDNLVIARGLTLVATQFMVPAQGQIDHTVTCMFDRDASMISLLGHEHAWGTHVKAERVGGTGEVLFDHDYDESMISHPLNTYYPVGAPYHIASGDGVRMTCSWNNTTDHPLTFPREMCVTFGWQIGAEQDTSCLDGVWRR